MLREVEVAAVRDPLELRPAHRVEVLDVARRARIVRELVRLVRARAQVALPDAVADVPREPLGDPVAIPLVRLARRHEVLHLHLLELERAEDEVSRRDLVPERLADLRDPERRLAACDLGDVLEVDEDALGRLGPEVDVDTGLLHSADARLEHQVELPRLGQIAIGRLAGPLRGTLAAANLLVLGVAEVVGTEALLAGSAVDERVAEAAHVAGDLPDPGVEDDRGVERDDVVPLTHHRLEPAGLDVVLQENAVVTVVV